MILIQIVKNMINETIESFNCCASLHPLFVHMHSANIIATNCKKYVHLLPMSIYTILTALHGKNGLTKLSIQMLQKEPSFVKVNDVRNGNTSHAKRGGAPSNNILARSCFVARMQDRLW